MDLINTKHISKIYNSIWGAHNFNSPDSERRAYEQTSELATIDLKPTFILASVYK